MSPHLTDSWIDGYGAFAGQPTAKPAASVIEALPLGGRIKVDPWNDHLTILKTDSVGPVADDEKKPFQITPFVIYLTRQRSAETPGATAAKFDVDTRP